MWLGPNPHDVAGSRSYTSSMNTNSRRFGFAVLSSILLSGLPASAQRIRTTPVDFEQGLKTILAENHARFVADHAAEIGGLTTVPPEIVSFVGKAARKPAEYSLEVKQRLILMKMQVNTLETIRLTLEGLHRLSAKDAPSEDQLVTAKVVIPDLHDRIRLLEAAAGAPRGAGMHEAARLAGKKLARLQELGQSLKQSNSWGADEILAMRKDLVEQLDAVAAEVPDQSLTPALKTEGLKEQWNSFNKAQQEGLQAADDALAQNKITSDEYESLIAGRRDLARMWEIYQEAWLKR